MTAVHLRWMPVAGMVRYAELVRQGAETFAERQRMPERTRREVLERIAELPDTLTVLDTKIDQITLATKFGIEYSPTPTRNWPAVTSGSWCTSWPRGSRSPTRWPATVARTCLSPRPPGSPRRKVSCPALQDWGRFP
jgi:hypothetical protein